MTIETTLNDTCHLNVESHRLPPQLVNTQRCQRQAKLFVRSQFGSTQNQAITIQRALSVDDLRSAYRLVHDTFVTKGYCSPQPNGMRLRVYEAMLKTATFIAKDNDRVVAVMSLVPDSSDFGLPSESIYPDEIGTLRRSGRRVGEVTNLAVDPNYRQSDLFFQLAQCMQAHAFNIGIDDLFVSISPGHANFFELFLGFGPWGERRSYSPNIVDMVEGKRLNLHTAEVRSHQHDAVFGEHAFLHDWFFANNPFLNTSQQRQANHALHHAESIRKLIGLAELLQRFTQNQCAAIRKQINTEILRGFQAAPAINAA